MKCIKRTYRGTCVQWDGNNIQELSELMTDDSKLVQYDMLVMVRIDGLIYTLKPTDWVVRGENGMVKHYTDDVYNIKYVTLG